MKKAVRHGSKLRHPLGNSTISIRKAVSEVSVRAFGHSEGAFEDSLAAFGVSLRAFRVSIAAFLVSLRAFLVSVGAFGVSKAPNETSLALN